MKMLKKTMIAAMALAMATACGADERAGNNLDSAGDNGGQPRQNTGVGQSGAQDFGRFRGIIEDGELPAPGTLDAVGFFNEHKIELPDPECGENVCLHGQLGVRGNMITGSNCTIGMVGFNTALSPDDFERPPLNMAIAVDVSGSMSGMPMEAVRAGLGALVGELDAKDTVSLIAYSSDAELVVDSTPETDPDRAQLREAITGLQALGDTNIYSGLRDALELVDSRADMSRQNRVVLLSDGVATSGIVDSDRILKLGESFAETGIGITTIGVGTEFDLDLMRGLAETGPGNFYFLEDVAAVEEVFTEEVQTFLVPVAEAIKIDFEVAEGYAFRAAYGTRLWTGDAEGARIEIPALFIASRQAPDDIAPGGGRRGGGGAILLELVPIASMADAESIGEDAPAGHVTMRYRQPGSEVEVVQDVTLVNPLKPGETPEGGEFGSDAVEKSFVALNIFAGFEMAIDRANNGAGNAALNVLLPLADSVEEWNDTNEDPDIEDDLTTMRQLIEVIENTGARETVGTPPEPWPRD